MSQDSQPPADFRGSQGVQAGNHNTQVNYYFPAAHPAPEAAGPPGWALAEVTDPFALEVHRPVQADHPGVELPVLPAYVVREHDQQLAGVVRAAAGGASGIAVLVGGSSTGKTRACWEALGLLRERPEQWRLWHPIDPSRPEAALGDLSLIGPRTVVWLNEAQFYLDQAAGGLGERVAAGLRELLRDKTRAPVLVLATLWPQHWNALTARPQQEADLHPHARELLAGGDIAVPSAFSAGQLRRLAATGDPRLARAAAAAEDGQVIQFLAGAPELIGRYRNAPPTAAALLDAAIDARRLGMGAALPLAFLEAAAPGYLTDIEWDGLGEDWLVEGLIYTAAPCNGIRGPLAGVRPRPAHNPEQIRPAAYRLADYLEQHGRRTRRGYIPPVSFWEAAARFASSADLPALAASAENRGLLRDAARLRRRATADGNAREAVILIRRWRSLHRHTTDIRPAKWASDHAALDDPVGVARLLGALREAGAHERIAALLARNPAAHASLDGVAGIDLLGVLWGARADEQVAALAARLVEHAPLENARVLDWLLGTLREVGAHEQAAALLARVHAAHAPLHHPADIARQLDVLSWAGADEQVAALLARDPAAHFPLDADVAALLDALRRVGADEQVAVLATRAVKHPPVEDAHVLALLLRALQRAGADEEFLALADRVAAHAPIDHPADVADLLRTLRAAGLYGQVLALADRAAAHAPIDHPADVANLLRTLREVSADSKIATLLARDPAAHAFLHHAAGVADLLSALQVTRRYDTPETCKLAYEQVAVLLARDPAAHAPLDDTGAVHALLDALRGARAHEQLAALAARIPDDLHAVNHLLGVLGETRALEQISALATRAAVHAPLDNTVEVDHLLATLREAGAEDLARTLIDRLPAEGRFGLFRQQLGNETRFRFGREVDGTAANAWGWDDVG